MAICIDFAGITVYVKETVNCKLNVRITQHMKSF